MNSDSGNRTSRKQVLSYELCKFIENWQKRERFLKKRTGPDPQ
jgi:hypothetical protein